MFTKITTIYIVLSYLLFANIFRGADSCFLYYKVHVTFINHLPAYFPQPLLVHCASKDDDLGNHTLTLNQRWGFAFCVKPFSTLFKCQLHWNGLKLSIDAYDAMWVLNPCDKGNCAWTVSAGGAGLPRGNFHSWEDQ
ncbi:hypothetical protein PHJA_000428400 [Phtheirospermum japonicum]|uniref:S-protein homolog n=1 Tax=Phtheirospermum japonicum TaxID=374723 RepID=A0A830BF14_9LAMI|nr:hypothetical protein PHJA_000428400 [Phtheirospermum japonicum]